MYRAWQVRQERRQAVFSYEREKLFRMLHFFHCNDLTAGNGWRLFYQHNLEKAVDSSLDDGGVAATDFFFITTPTSTPLPSTPTNTPEATATDTVLEVPGIDTPVAIDPQQQQVAQNQPIHHCQRHRHFWSQPLLHRCQ